MMKISKILDIHYYCENKQPTHIDNYTHHCARHNNQRCNYDHQVVIIVTKVVIIITNVVIVTTKVVITITKVVVITTKVVVITTKTTCICTV